MQDPIKHVVLLMLENASCDRYFGSLTDSILPDFDGVRKANPGINRIGNEVYRQEPTEEKQVQWDPHHEQADILADLEKNGANFVGHYAKTYPATTPDQRRQIMGYFPYGFLPAHHQLAASFRPCDRWFSSLPGPTWPNRFFALSGSSNGLVVMPDSRRVFTTSRMLFDETQPTLFSRLAEAKKSFKIFYHDFPSSLVLRSNRRPEVRSQYVPFENEFATLAAGRSADFPQFSFIEPRYYGDNQNDDHPPHNVMKAQKLVADVYNSLRKNPEIWNSCLLVILHDENGGFYDHVTPPMGAVPPKPRGLNDEYGFTQFGVRVPALLVSPWLQHGTEKTLFDHTSLVKYLVEKWQLASLGDRVASPQTNSIRVALDFTEKLGDDVLPEIILSNENIISPHPEWELKPTAHHYAMDLFQEVFTDDTGTLLAEELTSSGFRSKYRLARAAVTMMARDFVEGLLEKSRKAKEVRRKQRVQSFLRTTEAPLPFKEPISIRDRAS